MKAFANTSLFVLLSIAGMSVALGDTGCDVPNVCAFVDVGGTFTTIHVPGATMLAIAGVSASGQILGSFEAAGGHSGFFIDDHGTITFPSFNFPGAAATGVGGINNSGEVVGTWFNGVGGNSAYVLDHGTYTSISFLGSTNTFGDGINNSGTVVGAYFPAGTTAARGFIDKAGAFTS